MGAKVVGFVERAAAPAVIWRCSSCRKEVVVVCPEPTHPDQATPPEGWARWEPSMGMTVYCGDPRCGPRGDGDVRPLWETIRLFPPDQKSGLLASWLVVQNACLEEDVRRAAPYRDADSLSHLKAFRGDEAIALRCRGCLAVRRRSRGDRCHG